MRTIILLAGTAMVLLLVGCGTIRDHRSLSQPEGQHLTASVGSSLFRLNRKGDLPNAFGGRDIYGGKVDHGFAEAKLMRISSNRFVQLLVFDVSKDSAETTMDRYGPRSTIDVSQTVIVGTSTSAGGIVVTIDTVTEPQYVLAGVKITFIRVGRSSVVYTLHDVQQAQ